VRARHAQGHESDSPILDAGADLDANLDDRARAEVPHDVRDRRRGRPSPGRQVAALDADRLDIDQHAAAGALGVGHLLVAQNLTAAILVDHRRLQGARL
jgi:hypothetical protein